jgi:hypothetical protein
MRNKIMMIIIQTIKIYKYNIGIPNTNCALLAREINGYESIIKRRMLRKINF